MASAATAGVRSAGEGLLRVRYDDITFCVASSDAVVHVLVTASALEGAGYEQWERARRRWRERHSSDALSVVALTIAPCAAAAFVALVEDRKATAYHRRRIATLLRKWEDLEVSTSSGGGGGPPAGQHQGVAPRALSGSSSPSSANLRTATAAVAASAPRLGSSAAAGAP